jgi:hypothetical protein
MFRVTPLICVLPTLLLAQDMQARDTDTRFDRPTLDSAVRGNVLTFFDDGESRFFEDGRYTYTYANDGGTGYGYFTVQDDSTICISFVTGFSRCDLYVTDEQGRLTVITEQGDRFPTRP